MSDMNTWTVYLPYRVFHSPDGFLFGSVNDNYHVISITLLAANDNIQQGNHANRHLGIWRKHFVPGEENFDTGLICVYISEQGLPVCTLKRALSGCLCTCVIYDPEKLLSSFLLTNRAVKSKMCVQSQESGSKLDFVIKSLLYRDQEDKDRNHSSLWHYGIVSQSYVVSDVLSTTLSVFKMFEFLLHNRMTSFRFLKMTSLTDFIKPPSVVCELTKRYKEADTVLSLNRAIPDSRLRLLDAGCRQLLDTILGVLLMLVLTQCIQTEDIAAFITTWAEGVAEQLKILLNWLMGAPAGLKLNSQLTHFLGQFFLYHIYLWTGYLSLVQPFLGAALWYSSLMGVFGLSIQMCLLQDILSMMTLHIYCFYVYAARLYRLQMYTLSSLWRLVRGKKWNVLRHRVDSAPYDVDQLFLGTLLFTIFLFLLPTTALYYVVFTMLRMVVLIVQGILSHIVGLLSSFPVCSVSLWMLRSKRITGDVMFNVVPTDDTGDRCVYLSLQTTHLPFLHLISLRRPAVGQTKPLYSWGTFISRLINGHLIYPWIDLEESRNSKDKQS